MAPTTIYLPTFAKYLPTIPQTAIYLPTNPSRSRNLSPNQSATYLPTTSVRVVVTVGG